MGAPWKIASAGVAGISHAATGLPCQDAHACLVSGGRLVAVVSDGAGSARHSDVGSTLAVRLLVEAIDAEAGRPAAILVGGFAADLYERLAGRLDEEARLAGHDPRDYACTLLAAVIDEEGGAFLQLGDGAAVIRASGERDWRPALWPQHGRYANETNFLLGDRVRADLETLYVPGRVEEVALFTDGLENLVLDKAARCAPPAFFEHVAGPVRRLALPGRDEALSGHLARYLASPDVASRTDDDVTLVVASRGSPE